MREYVPPQDQASVQMNLPRWHKLDSGGQAACISLGLSVK